MYRKGRKNEHYTELAHKENYPARSVYKLKEIDEKYRILKKGDNVLDLGCAPGSWLLYISSKVGNEGVVYGIDTEDLNIQMRSNIIFVKKSIFDIPAQGWSASGGKDEELKTPLDCVVSDMAPKTSGVDFVDAGKSLELSEIAFELAKLTLRPGGNFVCKIFDNNESSDFFRKIEKYFGFAKRFKPKAVMKNSKEFYIVGMGFKRT